MDPDEAGMVVDRGVPDWFNQHRKGFQTRINAVLRPFVTRGRQR